MSMNVYTAAIALFSIVGITSVNNELLPEWMQYGSFGLCCVLVLYLMYQINELSKIIRQKDDAYIELLQKDIESRNRLSQLLEDRQCIAGDQRIKQ